MDFRKKCGINRTFAKINPREKRKRRKRRLWIGARKNILINFYNFIIIIYSWNIKMFHGWKNDLMSFYFVFGLSAMFFWPWHDLILVCSGRFWSVPGQFLLSSGWFLLGSGRFWSVPVIVSATIASLTATGEKIIPFGRGKWDRRNRPP